jgi:thiol-disulfide isomerase/thioredoxin
VFSLCARSEVKIKGLRKKPRETYDEEIEVMNDLEEDTFEYELEEEEEVPFGRDPIIHELDITNFDATVSNGSTWLVKFYAPWCDKSKALKPVMKELSEHVARNIDLDVHVAQVNGDEEVALSTRFYVEVKQMPYLYIITSTGRTHFFNESSKKEDILDFLLGGHEDAWSMHTVKNPMAWYWRLSFIPMSWITQEYGHMQALFIAYVSLLLIFCVTCLLTVHFLGEVIMHILIERMKRNFRKQHGKTL